MSFYNFAKQLCNFVMTLMYKIEYQGIENIPTDRGIILASNHTSNSDPMLIGIKCKRQLFFMAKEELFKNKLAGAVLKRLGAFPVSRGKGDNTAIETAIKTVKDGNVLAIFPEGTRSKDGVLRRAKSGAIVVAAKTGGDIVPTAVRIKEGRGIRKQVKIIYGNVIKNSDLGLNSDNPTEIKNASKLMMQEIGKLLDKIS